MKPFRLYEPTTINETVSTLRDLGDGAKLYAGGTELLLAMKAGYLHYDELVNVKTVAGLDRIWKETDGTLHIGPVATHAALESSPLVAECRPLLANVEHRVANVRVRNVGTIGGNICFAEPHSDPAAVFVLSALHQLDAAAFAKFVDVREMHGRITDGQLARNAGRTRRRFIDLLLTQTQPGYLPLLQRYMRAVRSRNALLKQRKPDSDALDSFTGEVVKCGNELMAHRRAMIPQLAEQAHAAFARIAPEDEELCVEYQPRVKNDFAEELKKVRERELSQGATLIGPHRDELKPLTGIALAEGLSNYAYPGDEYISSIQSVIRYNQLERYDLLN